MHRFQVQPQDISDNSLTIRGQDAHHLARVLRLGPGADIFVFDNSGFEYRARVKEINQDEVVCTLLDKFEPSVEPPLDVIVLQGIPKADKMELIVQKTTELGVRAIIPVRAARAVVHLEGKKAVERVERWQKIAAEAAKQCRRPRVPVINPIMDLAPAIKSLPPGTQVLAAYEAEEALGLREALESWPGGCVALVIGPEGGFAEQEIAFLKEQGALSISLGPRILRTETAGLAALTMVLYQLGDLGRRRSEARDQNSEK